MYKKFVSPILDRFGPESSESMHVAAREALHLAEKSYVGLRAIEIIACGGERFVDPRLEIVFADIEFENPLIVGAGWDKAGRAVRGLVAMGFAGVEVGSVLEYPQDGNPKPRQFMIDDGVCINRLGFNSPGMTVVWDNLCRYIESTIPIGISVGINKDVSQEEAPSAHARVVLSLYGHASYFVANVSSPNTPGLQKLQAREPLIDIVQAMQAKMDECGGRKPLFVKISPDLTPTAVDDVIRVVMDNGLAGIIASNTTINSDIKAAHGKRWANKAGGLSGDDAEFRKMSTEQIKHIYRETGGELAIIGVGGVKDAITAREKIEAGASAIQVVTAIRGEGPRVATKILHGLVWYMEKEGIMNISELVGAGVR